MHVNNENVFRKMETKLAFKIRMRQLKFIGAIMRYEGPESLQLRRHIVGISDTGIRNLWVWMSENAQTFLRATTDRRLKKPMIA